MAISELKIKDVASYSKEGVTIDEIKKLNFFLGFNGTGKSTIARYIYNLSLPKEEQSEKFSSCLQVGFNPNDEVIFVYDEEFKKRNFIDKDTLNGVFSLNEKNDSVESEIKKHEEFIKKRENQRQGVEFRLERIRKGMADEKDIIVKLCFQQRDKLKGFIKMNLKYGGSKDRHYKELVSLKNMPSNILDFESLQNDYQRLFEKQITKIEHKVSKEKLKEFEAYEQKLNKLLGLVIVSGTDIELSILINKLGIASWVNKGREFLEKSENICPFCQQELEEKEEFIRKLNLVFDSNYTEAINNIKELENKYLTCYSDIKKILEQMTSIDFLAIEVRDVVSKLEGIVNGNIELIREKLFSPNKKIVLSSAQECFDSIEKINEKIEKNDQDVENLTLLQNEFTDKCWNYMYNEVKDNIDKYEIKEKKAERIESFCKLRVKEISEDIEESRREINMLRTQTINTKTAVENINSILKGTGFTSFMIEEFKESDEEISSISRYRLKRENSEGNPYRTMSEGEKSLISFLYFHQLCIGTDDVEAGTRKKIIVIDDPISSLDSRSLFIVSSIVHSLILKADSNKNDFKNSSIAQVFILTHNLYFYKEVSFVRRPMCKDCTHFQLFRINGCETTIEKSTEPFPSDDYILMWNTIKKFAAETGIDEARNIMLSNTMRRIIDSYVNFTGISKGKGNPTWSSIYSLQINDPKYVVATTFISQINDESHSVLPSDSMYYSNVIRQDTSVLMESFELIFKEIGEEHFEMMMS
ncbi:AAA family ATPase [Porphyromonadaceae bacterium W3.11]|nr:AAA family ATPase [Porphyromonadaceae bacterium W3.11]